MESILAIIGIFLFTTASLTALFALFIQCSEMEKRIQLITFAGTLPFIALLIMHAVNSGRIPAFGRFEAITWYCLSMTVAYLHLSIKHRMQGISGITLPVITILLILAKPGIGTEFKMNSTWPAHWLALHVVTAFAGYALFTLAGILAVCYIIQDFNLKHKIFGAVFERLPSLETLDALMRKQIGFAFVVFSASIVFGIILVKHSTNAVNWHTDPKVASTAATWFIYAVLLHLRTGGDRHGRKIALATIAGILLVIFTFIGVHLLTDSAHDFVLPSPQEHQK
jgi:ABC-type transport system involved in cytochrome c biogenesis permease subunit